MKQRVSRRGTAEELKLDSTRTWAAFIGSAGLTVTALGDPRFTDGLPAGGKTLARVHPCAFSADGRQVFLCPAEGRAVLQALPGLKPIHELAAPRAGPLAAAAFSPDGAHVAAAYDGAVIRVWSTGTGLPTHELRSGDEVEAAVRVQVGGLQVRRILGNRIARCGPNDPARPEAAQPHPVTR